MTRHLPFALRFARKKGAELGPLLERFELDSAIVDALEWPVPTPQVRQVLDGIAELLGDDHFSLQHATENEPNGVDLVHRGHPTVLDYILLRSATIRDCLELLSRYAMLVSEFTEASLEKTPDGVCWHMSLNVDPLGCGRHHNEYTLASALLTGRRLADGELKIARAWFANPRPRCVDRLAAFLGTADLEFDCTTTGFFYPNEVLALRNRHADPHLLSILTEHADRLVIDSSAACDEERRELRVAISHCLEAGDASIHAVSRSMNLSVRTLQRRLAGENLTFEAEVDDLRHKLALHHVREGRVSIQEIALMLGYARSSAFIRAFRRWTGQTPLSLRQSSPPPDMPESPSAQRALN